MSKKLTTKEFVKKAKIVHNNKYNYDKVNYKGISTKVIVNCPEDGDFLQIPSNHLQGNGCPRCAIKIRSLNKKLTAEEFIRKSKKIHKNKYDYRRVVYIDSYTKVIIICPEHGKFLQRPNAHLMGRGCSICSKNKILTTEEFIIRAKKIHNDKYNYNKVNYKNYDTKVIITCPIHGDFLQIPDVHLHKHGCPKCMAVTNSLKQRHTVEQFVEAAKKVHGNKYDYSKVKYINNHTKIIVTCPKHGKFLQLPNNHLKNRGCKNCQKSKGELEVAKTLDKKNINYIKQKTFPDCRNPKTNYLLSYDFYLPQQNALIEFNGEQHYRNLRHWHKGKKTFASQQYRDRIKKDYALSNNYKYLIIKYDENIEEKLNNICC